MSEPTEDRPIEARIADAEAEGDWGEAMRLKLQRVEESRGQPAGRSAEERQQIHVAEQEGRWFDAMSLELHGAHPPTRKPSRISCLPLSRRSRPSKPRKLSTLRSPKRSRRETGSGPWH